MADPKAPGMVAFPESLYSALGGGAVGSPCMVSLEMIRAALSAHGLAIVSEADRKVLEACAALPEKWLRDGISIAESTGGTTVWLCKSELARRSGDP